MTYDLQTSISTGNLVRVQVLMIDNKKNRDAALRLATIYNQPKIVTMALEQGADPHQLDELNRTPIAYAQQNGHDEIIALLETYQAAHPLQRDLNVDAFREQVLSGDLANMRHVYKAFKSIDDEDMSIEVEQDVIVQFLTQLRSETNQEESNTRWIPMANFLYKNSEAYRLLIKSISGQVCYDEPLKLGAGFLYSFIENNNLAGFKLMLAHGFPLNSIQLISRDNIFNALQMALIVYENDEISLPFIDALLEQGATLPKTDEALYLSPDKIWKLDKNQTELSEKIQSKAVARASVIGFVGQLLTMHEKPSFYRYLNELFQIKSIARFSEIANPMNAPQLISQLETEDDPFQTAINETLSFFSKPPCLDIAQIHEEPLEAENSPKVKILPEYQP